MSVRPDANFKPIQETGPAAGWAKVRQICFEAEALPVTRRNTYLDVFLFPFFFSFLSLYCRHHLNYQEVVVVQRVGSSF